MDDRGGGQGPHVGTGGSVSQSNWERRLTGLWVRPVPVLALAALLFAGVFALRVTTAGLGDAVVVLFVLPIALLAARFGATAGIAAAAFSTGLVALHGTLIGPQLSALGYATRVVAFIVLGAGLGYASQRTRRAEQTERELIATAPDALVQIDDAGRIVLVNAAAERLFGYECSELLGQPLEILVPERLREAHERRRSGYMTHPELRPMGEGLLLHARRRDGTAFPTEISLVPRRLPTGALVTAIVRDVSARVSSQAELRASERRYRALLEHAPDAIVVLDVATGCFVQVNEEAVRLFGLPREHLLELGPVELSPPTQPDGRPSSEAAIEVIEAAIAGGTPRFEWVHRTGDGHDIPCEIRLLRLPDPNHVLVRGSIIDIRERKQAERERTRAELERAAAERTRRLQQVTEAALAYLDLDKLARELVARCRAVLAADTAALLLLAADDRTLTVQAAVGFPDETVSRASVRVGEGFAGQIAATRRAIAVEDLEASGITGEALGERSVRAVAGVPLTTGERLLGVLEVGSLTARQFSGEELELLRLAGERIGLALLHARLFERERMIAQTLQRSLLPDQLPQIPGVAVTARYEPGGQGMQVGGDFYDIFPAGPASWMIVIGDVCGKGAHAAARTALARYTLRAEALHDPRPARLLRRLNAAMLAQATDSVYLTAVCALLTIRETGATLALASGGHPAPLILRADGSVDQPNLAGPLIGAFRAPKFHERTLALGPGATILFYTDGLLEAHAPQRLVATDELAGLLAAGPRDDVEHMVTSLLEDTGATAGGCRDDIAVIAAQLTPTPSNAAAMATVPAARQPA
jgi:PAS domain S-box-containing protein